MNIRPYPLRTLWMKPPDAEITHGSLAAYLSHLPSAVLIRTIAAPAVVEPPA